MNICKYICSLFIKKEDSLNESEDSNLSLSSETSTSTIVTTSQIIDENEKNIYSNNIPTNYEC